MNEPMIRFPVSCPQCGNEELGEYRIADVANALLLAGNTLPLYASCHDYYWTASQWELQQIREYLGALWLGQPAGLTSVHDFLAPRD
jgi:hypothetical protein